MHIILLPLSSVDDVVGLAGEPGDIREAVGTLVMDVDEIETSGDGGLREQSNMTNHRYTYYKHARTHTHTHTQNNVTGTG